jgi:hypothetical protein
MMLSDLFVRVNPETVATNFIERVVLEKSSALDDVVFHRNRSVVDQPNASRIFFERATNVIENLGKDESIKRVIHKEHPVPGVKLVFCGVSFDYFD